VALSLLKIELGTTLLGDGIEKNIGFGEGELVIFKDDYGFPVCSTLDAGDSSMRAGMIMLTGMPKTFPCYAYEIAPGNLTRHPKQFPWNNPRNFTRDQMLPLIAGLNAKGQWQIIERVMFATIKRFGFAQNFDRDKPGTAKYPWPHWFTNDRNVLEFSAFDFADPLLPNVWGCLIIGARATYLYWLLPICYLFHIISILSSKSHDEQNQIIAEMSFYGRLSFRLYMKLNTNWKKQNHEYWYNRNEGEYADKIEEYVEGKT
jgi:hypothetical protein